MKVTTKELSNATSYDFYKEIVNREDGKYDRLYSQYISILMNRIQEIGWRKSK